MLGHILWQGPIELPIVEERYPEANFLIDSDSTEEFNLLLQLFWGIVTKAILAINVEFDHQGPDVAR